MVLVFLSIMNYLIDAYVIFAAYVLAAHAVLRSLFGAAFPLFTVQMYDNLGVHWATMIPFFLALLCVPFPFVLYKYGPAIRTRCKYAAEAAAYMDRIRNAANEEAQDNKPTRTESETTGEYEEKLQEEKLAADADVEKDMHADEEPEEAFDYNYEHDGPSRSAENFNMSDINDGERAYGPVRSRPANLALQRTSTSASRNYEHSPYDIDRVATRESFMHERPSARGSARTSLDGRRSVKSGKLSCM